DDTARDLELRDGAPADAEAEHVGQIGLAYPGGVAIDDDVSVRPGDRAEREIVAERAHHADVESHAGVGDLRALLGLMVRRISKGSTRGDPIRSRDHVERAAHRPALLKPV